MRVNFDSQYQVNILYRYWSRVKLTQIFSNYSESRGRILVRWVTQFFRSKWLHFFLSLLSNFILNMFLALTFIEQERICRIGPSWWSPQSTKASLPQRSERKVGGGGYDEGGIWAWEWLRGGVTPLHYVQIYIHTLVRGQKVCWKGVVHASTE